MPVQVTDCYFPKDKYLNRRKNFCFVTFATQQVQSVSEVSIRSQWMLCVHGPLVIRQYSPISSCFHSFVYLQGSCAYLVQPIVQAAEKAAAQSDREINGYRIESISVTHDRHTHYQRQSATPSQVSCPLPCSCIHILSGGM